MVRFNGSQKSSGFTLIEAIISMGLLAIMMLYFLPSLLVMNKSNAVSEKGVAASNIALTLVEQLYNENWANVGSHTLAGCKNSNGKVTLGTSQGVCSESLLNNTGYSAAEATGDTIYPFKRHSVVCNNALTIAGTYTGDVCNLPTSGPMPSELSCNPANYDANKKEIKVLVAYYDGDGKCHHYGLNHLKIQ